MRKIISAAWQTTRSQAAVSVYTLFAGNVVDAVFAFLFTVTVFRYLSTAQFGIFSAINNFLFTVVLILDLGISSGLLYFIPRHTSAGDGSDRQYLNTAVFLRLTLSAAAAFLLIAVSPLLTGLFKTSETSSLVAAALALVSVSVFDVGGYALQGYHKFFKAASYTASYSVFRFVFALVFYRLGYLTTVTSATLITAIAAVPGIFLMYTALRLKNLHPPHPGTTGRLLKFSGWMGIYKLASTISTRLDVQILLLLSGPVTAGIYSVAGRLANFYPLIVISLTSVLASRVSASHQHLPKSFTHKAVLAISGLITAMLIGIFISPWLVPLLFGVKAIPAVPVFQGLTLAYMPLMLSILPSTVLVYFFQKTKYMAVIGIIQLAITLFGNLIFTARLNIFGPPLALGLAHITVLVVSSILVIRLFMRNQLISHS